MVLSSEGGRPPMPWGPIEQKCGEERSILFLCLTAWAVALAFSSFWVGTHTIDSPGSQAFRISWNYTTGFPGSVACRWQITGLLSFHHCMSQFLATNLFINMCISIISLSYPIGSVSLQNPINACSEMNRQVCKGTVLGQRELRVESKRQYSWDTVLSGYTWLQRVAIATAGAKRAPRGGKRGHYMISDPVHLLQCCAQHWMQPTLESTWQSLAEISVSINESVKSQSLLLQQTLSHDSLHHLLPLQPFPSFTLGRCFSTSRLFTSWGNWKLISEMSDLWVALFFSIAKGCCKTSYSYHVSWKHQEVSQGVPWVPGMLLCATLVEVSG